MSALPRLSFVDLETTGGNATIDRITEIGIVEVHEDGVREWSTLVNPQTSIPTFIQTLTGITNAMVAEAPTFAELADEVFDRLEGRVFIAHNARFDYGFLKNEFRRIGYDFRPKVLCTVKLSRKLYPHHSKHNLDSLIARHGLKVDGRHRALADAQLIHQFWQRAQDDHSAEVIAQAVKELTARSSLPSHLDAAIVDELPEGSGVYLFYGENALPIYVGKAKNIRQRVLSHFASDHASAKEMSLAQQVRRIDWIETPGEVAALLKEAALIKELQPTLNRQLRRNNDLCSIVLEDQGAGLVTPRVVHTRDLDFGQQVGIYGLFKTIRAATTELTEIADREGLCHSLLGLDKVKAGKPCFAHQVRKCKGACVGKEPSAAHTVRLVQALSALRLQSWPFAGPAYVKEGDELLIVDKWCYLGTAKADEDVWGILEQRRPQFDRDTYRILVKVAGRMRALTKVQ